MVDTQVATSSVVDRQLLAVMRRIPRERFVPADQQALAYIDRSLPVGGGRMLTAPAPFARMVELAAITPADKVLDAASGTGYSTAVLAALSSRTVALESDPKLAQAARETLAAERVTNVSVVTGALQAAGEAPFDVVVVEDIVEAPPTSLLALMREGGRLVALIATEGAPPVPRLFLKQGNVLAGGADFDALLPSRKESRAGDNFVF